MALISRGLRPSEFSGLANTATAGNQDAIGNGTTSTSISTIHSFDHSALHALFLLGLTSHSSSVATTTEEEVPDEDDILREERARVNQFRKNSKLSMEIVQKVF